MEKILFIYDKLMLAREQRLVGLNAEFLTFAQVNAKMYWFADREYGKKRRKKKRIFLIPKSGTKVCYGALYKIDDYEFAEHKLHSYYYSMKPFIGKEDDEQLYVLRNVLATPIKFDSLSALQNGKYKTGAKVECETFIGNVRNETISYNSSKSYYKIQGIDHENFIELVREKQGEMKHGLE